ncbi:MAG: hypothetical protein WAW61_13195 [Methylococcaceae bacterium]
MTRTACIERNGIRKKCATDYAMAHPGLIDRYGQLGKIERQH